MFDPEETLPDALGSTAFCEVCSSPLPATRYVHVEGWVVSALCSEPCLGARRRQSRRVRWSARRLHAKRLAVAVVLGAALLTPHAGPDSG
jgi:hypothetical protein